MAPARVAHLAQHMSKTSSSVSAHLHRSVVILLCLIHELLDLRHAGRGETVSLDEVLPAQAESNAVCDCCGV